MSSEPFFSAVTVRSRCAWTRSPLMAAAENPRERSRSASSSVADFVRTKMIMASPLSTSSRRVSASSFAWCETGIQR